MCVCVCVCTCVFGGDLVHNNMETEIGRESGDGESERERERESRGERGTTLLTGERMRRGDALQLMIES